MESERRLIAAGLVALLACGLWYVWDDRTVDEALLATDRRRGEATAGEEKGGENRNLGNLHCCLCMMPVHWV